LFTVNTKNGSSTGVSFEINLELKPDAIETLFEGGRTIPVSDGKVIDSFSTYEAHVYYWDEPEPQEEETPEDTGNADSRIGDSNGGGGSCFITTGVSNFSQIATVDELTNAEPRVTGTRHKERNQHGTK
jgi:hypothetical protein